MAAEFTPDPSFLASLAGEVNSSLETYAKAGDRTARGQALNKLAQAAQRLSLSATDPADAFADFTFQPLANAAVRVALSMGLFSHISSSKSFTVEEVAQSTSAQVALTARVIRALVAFGFIRETEDGRFKGTPLSDVYADESQRSWAIWLWDVMCHTSGKLGPYYDNNPLQIPADHQTSPFAFAHDAVGSDIFEIVRKIGKLPLLTAAMSGSSKLCAEEAVATYPFDKLVPGDNDVVIVDVGGSQGQTLLEIKHSYSALKGRMIVQDLPSVIERGAMTGLDAELQSYNFFEEVEPVKGAAAYMYQRIFHDWNDESSQLILQNLKPAMSSHSKLIISDVVIPDHQPHPRKILRDMNMFLIGGMERSEKQWHELLEGQGFVIEKIYGLYNGNNSIIEAKLKDAK